jgi:hypothetical protein
MIFNTELFFSLELSAEELLTILIIKDKAYSRNETRRDSLNSLFKKGYIEMVKGKEKDPAYTKARLSRKGKNLLRDLEIPGISDGVKELGTELITMYEDAGVEDRIGNKKKIMRLLAWYLMTVDEVECSSNSITQAVDTYLREADKQRVIYLENLIWKAPSAFSVHPTLENSKLHELINKTEADGRAL